MQELLLVLPLQPIEKPDQTFVAVDHSQIRIGLIVVAETAPTRFRLSAVVHTSVLAVDNCCSCQAGLVLAILTVVA